MKKLKRITILLLLVSCLFSLSACGGANKTETETESMEIPSRFPAQYADTAWRTATDGEYMIADYEDDFEYVFLGITGDSSTFGSLKISDEQATKGSKSLKVTVYGDGKFMPADTENVYFRIDTSSGLSAKQDMRNDYTQYSCFKFDMYNAMDVDSMVGFYVNDKTWHYSFKLQPGWNSVTVPRNAPTLNQRSNGDRNDFTTVARFGFIFQKYDIFQDLQTYYIDNLRACV